MADRIGGMAPQARGHSPEQNPINVFLVHECKMVPQHKSCTRMVLTPKIRLDSNETARLATTTRGHLVPADDHAQCRVSSQIPLSSRARRSLPLRRQSTP